MPLYDYTCDKCKKTFEIKVPLEKLDESILCPYCDTQLKRELCAPSFKIN